jgi:hypothetical protein
MKKISKMNIGELAAFICSHLAGCGIECTLTGGACVSIYSENKYLSYDLDFIESGWNHPDLLRNAMKEIGFLIENRYFVNPECKFFVEFPKGPLSIGSEQFGQIAIMQFSTGELRILSATDCIKDRLAAYYFWDDKQSLEQALMVARSNDIDLNEIERWSRIEGNINKYHFFKGRL